MNEEGTKCKSKVIQYNLEQTTDRIPALVKEKTYDSDTDIFMSPEIISDFCKSVLHLDRQCEEHIYLMGLDVKGHVLGLFEVGHGTISMAPCCIQGVACRLLLAGAPNAILVHNHPSGEVSPSMEDERLAERISEVTDLLGIKLLDFIVVGDDYYSFCEHGLLRNGSRG